MVYINIPLYMGVVYAFPRVLGHARSQYLWDYDYLGTISESSTNIITMESSVPLEVSFETQTAISSLLHSTSFEAHDSTKSSLTEPPEKLHLVYKYYYYKRSHKFSFSNFRKRDPIYRYIDVLSPMRNVFEATVNRVSSK